MSKVSFCKLVIQQTFETKASSYFNIHLFSHRWQVLLSKNLFFQDSSLEKNNGRISVVAGDVVFGEERSSFH